MSAEPGCGMPARYGARLMKTAKQLVFMISFFVIVVVALAATSLAADKADYVFKNGAIYTIDSTNPTAQAIAITGKHITYVGTNEGVVQFIGDKTQVIDLKGQM